LGTCRGFPPNSICAQGGPCSGLPGTNPPKPCRRLPDGWRSRRYHINRSNLLVLESKADMQKRGQASPDDGDALALTFAQPVAPAEVEEEDEEEEFGRFTGSSNSGWMR
jgi:hypothetical protein